MTPERDIAHQRILIVDDDASQRSLLQSFLSSQGFETDVAASAEEAEARLQGAPPALIVSDVRMPGMSGLELLRRARQRHAELPVLLVTAYADVRDAVGAIRDGAVNYLEKPIDLDELLESVSHALGVQRRRTDALPDSVPLPEGVVARSAAMMDVLHTAALVGASESRVLISGESGVGKEVVANAIHAFSPRSGGAFVKVNCAAIPETIMESELFGHEKGAFTGAVARRRGYFEEADKGTILLDEIGELSPATQAKLLRVIQDGSFQRVGSVEPIQVDTRVLVATNCDLEEAMLTGRFREDLYYRLSVFEIYVPPLRERIADILPLARQFASEFGSGKPRFSPAAIGLIEQYRWPGNVRELRNAIERATLLARGEVILPEHLPPRVRGVSRGESAEEAAPEAPGSMAEVERNAILHALREHQYNRTAAARALGISRRTLIYKLSQYRREGFEVDG